MLQDLAIAIESERRFNGRQKSEVREVRALSTSQQFAGNYACSTFLLTGTNRTDPANKSRTQQECETTKVGPLWPKRRSLPSLSFTLVQYCLCYDNARNDTDGAQARVQLRARSQHVSRVESFQPTAIAVDRVATPDKPLRLVSIHISRSSWSMSPVAFS